MTKKVIATLLSFLMLVSVFAIIPSVDAYAASTKPADILKRLAELEKKFPDGKYWNHYGSSKVDVNKWTDTPCPDGHKLNGVQQCNGQCDGFARKLGQDLFGKSTYKWENVSYNLDTLCVGDIIRYGNRHTIMVTGFTPYDDEIIITDCNWDYHCGISWNRYFSTYRLSNVNWVLHYPGNNFNRETYLNMPVSSFKLSMSERIVPAGEWFSIGFEMNPQLPGVDYYSRMTWTSSNPEVATVDNGYIQTLAEGTATITATLGNMSSSCELIVTKPIYIDRLYGRSRIATAYDIADRSWGYDIDNLILTNAYSFADALAGVPLSKALDAPILLTANSSEGLDEIVEYAFERFNPDNVYILGGNLAVSKEIEQAISALGLNVIRIAGASRFETAVKIAEELEKYTGQAEKVFFTNAYSFADALSVGSPAALLGCPILYTPADGNLDSTTREFLGLRGITDAVLIGGVLSVSHDIKPVLTECGVPNHKRVCGTSRFDTCLAIVKEYSDLFAESTSFGLATGYDFPDALAGGAFAAKHGIPLILAGTTISDDMKEWLKATETNSIYVFGGYLAVSEQQVYNHTL